MKVLHISPHIGGGIGTVIQGWTDRDKSNKHEILLLDIAKTKRKMSVDMCDNAYALIEDVRKYIGADEFDIVVVHWYDHPMLRDLISKPLRPCRLAFWCHKRYDVPQEELDCPDVFIDTSPIQGHGKYIWSTGNMERFLAIEPKPHDGFNIGYVGTVDYKKMHPKFYCMCCDVIGKIPEARFTIVGENHLSGFPADKFTFTGKVDDVAPYLAEMDVFGYPLRSDHYGTCEIALGEAMAAGVVPVVMRNSAEQEIMEDAKSGYLEPTEEDYIDAIQFLYDNPSARESMSRRTRLHAQELYSIDTMIQQWDEVFQEMMKKPKTKKGGM